MLSMLEPTVRYTQGTNLFHGQVRDCAAARRKIGSLVPFNSVVHNERTTMKYGLAILAAATLFAAVPASAEDVGVGVGVGPVGAGVTVGAGHDRDRDRDRTTVIREREEPRDKTVIIKRDREREPDRKVIIDR
jgi:hypothetical protein